MQMAVFSGDELVFIHQSGSILAVGLHQESGKMSIKGKSIRWFMEYAPSGARTWAISKLIGDYGKMLEFKFDPHKKFIHLKVKLAGEKEPIEVEILDYELKDKEQQPAIVVRSAKADREWINILIRDMLLGKEIPVPAEKFKLIHEILKE